MMEKGAEQAQVTRATNAIDVALVVVALLALGGGIWAFYHYEDTQAAWVRWLMVLGAFTVALLIAYASKIGRDLWSFIQGSRVELRKVVWPNRDDTVKTTLVVFVFIGAAGVFFWLLDIVLSRLAKMLTGVG